MQEGGQKDEQTGMFTAFLVEAITHGANGCVRGAAAAALGQLLPATVSLFTPTI